MKRNLIAGFLLASVILYVGCGGPSVEIKHIEPYKYPLWFVTIDKVQFKIDDLNKYHSGGKSLYKREDPNSAWQAVNLGIQIDDEHPLHALDADQGKLYVASEDVLLVSDDLGGSFHRSFVSYSDPINDVDFEKGYGWIVVGSYGAYSSGPWSKTPDGQWQHRLNDIPTDYRDNSWVIANKTDPKNAAEIGGYRYPGGNYKYRTEDGGLHWEPF